MPRILDAGVLAYAAALIVAHPTYAGDEPQTVSTGKVFLVERTTPQFDVYTRNPPLPLQNWLLSHFNRMVVYSPYFDTRTSWYKRAWVYADSYAIYRNPPPWFPDLASTHPEWILRDAAGNKLFIPWGCGPPNGCPQYAADFSNPDFQHWWIDFAGQAFQRGAYRGLWIDDVNMDWRVGDANGNSVTPMDPHTGAAMTQDAWRGYFATFLEAIRRAMPNIEIVHNAIWYAGGSQRQANPAVQRQIAAATWVNIEHGVNDSGLTGGNGPWSLRALLGYIDSLHKMGRLAIVDGAGGETHTPATLEYALACYFLIAGAADGLGDGGWATPSTWWPGFEVALGAPAGPRTNWSGLMRRDFASGLVLVNEPGAARVTVTLPGSYIRIDSSVVTEISLAGGDGAVLRTSLTGLKKRSKLRAMDWSASALRHIPAASLQSSAPE